MKTLKDTSKNIEPIPKIDSNTPKSSRYEAIEHNWYNCISIEDTEERESIYMIMILLLINL